MAHFALIDDNQRVAQVVVVANSVLLDENDVEQEANGVAYCNQVIGQGLWVQTSYHGKFRGCFAGIGYTYDPAADIFVPPAPFGVDESQLSPNA